MKEYAIFINDIEQEGFTPVHNSFQGMLNILADWKKMGALKPTDKIVIRTIIKADEQIDFKQIKK